MTATAFKEWDPNEWEEYVHSLLALRYGPGDYQRVPATHGGDCGIEGFSTDGCAYQCYAAQGYTSVDNLYKKQRDKMSTDIKKFIQNRARLTPLLGTLKIRRWLLVVPVHNSHKLVGHAADKSADVLKANLPYVHAEFRAGVITDGYFAKERAELSNAGGVGVDSNTEGVDLAALKSDFTAAAANSDLLKNLSEKLARMPNLQDPARHMAAVAQFTHGYLRGKVQMGFLHETYPQVHRRVLAFIQRKETAIALLSSVNPAPAHEFLSQQLKELQRELLEAVPSVTPIVDDIVAGTLADWLMRCPLQLYESSSIRGNGTDG